jgi:hypothetical protein
MSTTTTAGKNSILAGIKAQMESSGGAASAVLVYLAGATIVCSQTVTANAPSGGTMQISSATGTATATGTITSAELRDRSSSALRSYTVGIFGSGRDIQLTISGTGVSASGNDIVVSQTGATFGIATIIETAN